MRPKGTLPKRDFEDVAPRYAVSAFEVQGYIHEMVDSIDGHVLLPGVTDEQAYAFKAGYLQGIAATFEAAQLSVKQMDPIIAPMVAQSFHHHCSFIIAVAQRLRAQLKK